MRPFLIIYFRKQCFKCFKCSFWILNFNEFKQEGKKGTIPKIYLTEIIKKHLLVYKNEAFTTNRMEATALIEHCETLLT